MSNTSFSVFRLLEFIFNNLKAPIILSKHLLQENTSILECLIKMKKLNLSSICCTKSSPGPSDNELFLKSAFFAMEKKYTSLLGEIIVKCYDINSSLSDGETLLTKIFKEKSITSEEIFLFLSNTSFNYEKKNHLSEYPLLLACRKLALESVKVILNNIPIDLEQMDQCLTETISSYTSFYINSTYKAVSEFNIL